MRHDHELTHMRNYVVRWLSAFVTWCVTVFIYASDKTSAPEQSLELLMEKKEEISVGEGGPRGHAPLPGNFES